MLSDAYTVTSLYGQPVAPNAPMSLSVVIGGGTFMYATFANGFKTVVEICSVKLNGTDAEASQDAGKISFLIQNFFLHRKKFEKVNIALLNQQFALVPEAYGSHDPKALLKFTNGGAVVRTALKHTIKGIRFLYTVEHELLGYLEKTFANASIRHAGAVSAGLFYSQHSLLNSQVFVQLHDTSLEIAIRQHQELVFYNVFTYTTNEDILYYLLFAIEQFGLDPLLLRLSLAGQMPPGDELLKSLRRYVKQVELCVSDPLVQLTGDLIRMPQHYYFTLLNQHLCEL